MDWEDGPIEVNHLEEEGQPSALTETRKSCLTLQNWNTGSLTGIVHSSVDRHVACHRRSQSTESLGLAFYLYM